jgi:wyosine [tRNA(Phe)-imidazoG37] synthetase (radical SAM superfamily)
MKYVFGPVPSRRLGQSLGIDTIPLKTCNWNCVYCQLGRTVPLTNQCKDYYPPGEILAEVRQALQAHKPGDIDWVTFVGSGEPLLCASTGWLIRQVKALTEIPIAVITNGSLLYRPMIRKSLSAADAVLPTLDAGSPRLYRKINRPHPAITFERLIAGLIAFRQEYAGKLWVEVMLVKGLNDAERALHDLAVALRKIQPDVLHINLPTRPPAESWVEPPDQAGLLSAKSILGTVAEVVPPPHGIFDLSGEADILEAILGIIDRHPMRQEELESTLDRWSPDTVARALQDLAESGRVQVVQRLGARFWCAEPGHYPGDAHSRKMLQ